MTEIYPTKLPLKIEHAANVLQTFYGFGEVFQFVESGPDHYFIVQGVAAKNNHYNLEAIQQDYSEVFDVMQSIRFDFLSHFGVQTTPELHRRWMVKYDVFSANITATILYYLPEEDRLIFLHQVWDHTSHTNFRSSDGDRYI